MAIKPLNQRDPKWKDIKLGFSDLTISTHGCTITSLASILGTTPDIVNEKLKSVKGFLGALIIWSKIPEAFPQIKVATRHWSYNNDIVSKNLPCLVEVDGKRIGASKHWVAYMGGQQMMDPWYGTVKGTSYYPPTGMTVLEIDGNYNPGEAKIYTETQMSEMREQRDGNHNKYTAEKEAHGLTKLQRDLFIEKLANMYGSVKSEESIIKFATENSRVIDERDDYKDKWQREVTARKKDYEKYQVELTTLREENESLARAIAKQQLKIESAIENSDNAKEILTKAQNGTSNELRIITFIKELIAKLFRKK